MIDRSEILKLAKQYGVLANIIEKDYILGWLVFTNIYLQY